MPEAFSIGLSQIAELFPIELRARQFDPRPFHRPRILEPRNINVLFAILISLPAGLIK